MTASRYLAASSRSPQSAGDILKDTPQSGNGSEAVPREEPAREGPAKMAHSNLNT